MKSELQKCILGSVYTNCYFLQNKETGELLIVDPAARADKIFQQADRMWESFLPMDILTISWQ